MNDFGRVTFIVEGSGTFPLDMLCVDACYPATPADTVAIFDPSLSLSQRQIKLRRTHRLGFRAAPEVAKWALCGWAVREVYL